MQLGQVNVEHDFFAGAAHTENADVLAWNQHVQAVGKSSQRLVRDERFLQEKNNQEKNNKEMFETSVLWLVNVGDVWKKIQCLSNVQFRVTW